MGKGIFLEHSFRLRKLSTAAYLIENAHRVRLMAISIKHH